MDPQTAPPSGMTREEKLGPVPQLQHVIPEFAEQISGTQMRWCHYRAGSRISPAGFPG